MTATRVTLMSRRRPANPLPDGEKPYVVSESAEHAWARYAQKFGLTADLSDALGRAVPCPADRLRDPMRNRTFAVWDPATPWIAFVCVTEPRQIVVIAVIRTTEHHPSDPPPRRPEKVKLPPLPVPPLVVPAEAAADPFKLRLWIMEERARLKAQLPGTPRNVRAMVESQLSQLRDLEKRENLSATADPILKDEPIRNELGLRVSIFRRARQVLRNKIRDLERDRHPSCVFAVALLKEVIDEIKAEVLPPAPAADHDDADHDDPRPDGGGHDAD